LRMSGLQTVGFHLGERSSTIDLEGADLDTARIAEAEREANLEVMKDSIIESRIVSRGEYEEIVGKQDERSRIRSRLPEGVETVRVVEIRDVDVCSCCGTHCGRTGEIGPIKIIGTEKVRGNLRVEFLCGMRAHEDYAAKHDQLSRIAAVFTTDWRECLGAVERVNEENRALRREAASLGRELASYRAGDIGGPELTIGSAEVYTRSFDEAGADEVREMVNRLKSEDGRIILFGIKAPKPSLIFACSEGLGLDMGEVMKVAAGVMGARGGGRGSFAQGGGGDPGLVDEAIEAAVESARKELT
ncbi:MAG TPA: DHHA1 domain-containing protein, partial [Candidatus Krumholzibacterium sp.]|nr:DHHA1 domain-containing protein [Candidatus Krumholzibacterium sp.]